MSALSLIDTVFTLALFFLGASIGSFINVVIYRYQTGAKIAMDRSRCMSCGKTLAPSMLVPVVSFLLQKGRCAYCLAKLSWQYPLVECLGGIILLVVFWKSISGGYDLSTISMGMRALEALLFFVLLAVTVYDLKHKIIPDRFVVILTLVAVLHALLAVASGEKGIFPSFATGVGIALPFAVLWAASRGRWMGLGDAKLAFPLGVFLGFPVGVAIPVLAFWLGTIPAIVLLLLRRGITMKSEIPFAPFLALATFLLYVYPIDLLQLQVIWPHLRG